MPTDPNCVPRQSYKAQFLLAQQRQQQQPQEKQEKKKASKTRTLTREESLMSIADAILPPGLRLETESELPDNHHHTTKRPSRGHSVSFYVY
jgi:hypothetical protein